MPKKSTIFPNQIIPLFLTGGVFLLVSVLLYAQLLILNRLVISRETILLKLQWTDVLVGLTIYLKTSIDFAIFIGRLMSTFPGWKNRVMIEIGTALGNAAGTLGILIIWDLFREARLLMAAMILLAALVLFRLAEEGLEHAKDSNGKFTVKFWGFETWFERVLIRFNASLSPVLNKLVPRLSFKSAPSKGYWPLFALSFSVPFILGLDDFAGYIPLFNIVNVFGFAVGVFLGHMLLNLFLFLSPDRTISAVKHPLISFLGSLAFVGLGLWGLTEVLRLLRLI